MEPPSPYRIGVINQTPFRPDTAHIEAAVASVLQRHGHLDGEVSLLLTDDEEVRRLNREYRGIDLATDVLSFPAPDFPGAPIGEIAISVPYAEKQAAARGIPVKDEVTYLAIHGVLHLVGLEDESEPDRSRMMSEMAEIGRLLGLAPEPEWSSLLHEENA